MKTPCCNHSHVPRLVQQPMDELTAKLRGSSRKITGPRQAILEVLRRHSHPLTNKEIRQALGKSDCDLATIYRNMHTLEEMGLVKRFDFGDGAARFELVHDGPDNHHHHLVCTECSLIVEIDDCFPEELEKKLADTHQFYNVTHRLEFFGMCRNCHEARHRPVDRLKKKK